MQCTCEAVIVPCWPYFHHRLACLGLSYNVLLLLPPTPCTPHVATSAELLATSEQVELFRRESYHEATKYAKLGAGVGKVQPQTGRRFVGGARLAPAEGPRLNTDRLWEELAQLQKARE